MKNSCGMWSGKHGLREGAEANRAARDEVLSTMTGQIEELIGLLREIEDAIDRAGAVLSISQPARISGKYGLRWWKVKPDLPYREPVIVRWVMQKNGKMTPKRAKILKARDSGAFAINAAETQECLEVLANLIKRRQEIKGRIFSVSKSLRGLGAISYRLNNELEKIGGLRERIIGNLLSNGYEVEPRLMADVD